MKIKNTVVCRLLTAGLVIYSISFFSAPLAAQICRGVDPNTAAKVELDKTAVYPDQAVILTYDLLTRSDIRFEGLEGENLRGFWLESYPQKDAINKETVEFDGYRYLKATVKRVALFPIAAGKHILQPAAMKVQLTRHTSKTTGTDWLKCDSLEIQIQDFPAQNKPKNFSGSSGHFQIEAELKSPSKESTGLATLIVKVTGQGNLRQIRPTFLQTGSDVKIVDQKEESYIFLGDSAVQGRKVFTVQLAPLHTGRIKIPAMSFAYFDPETKEYAVAKTEPFSFQAENVPQSPSKIPAAPPSGKNELVILLDSSGSMMAFDFQPSRLVAAQDAIEAFLKKRPELRIGVKLFGNDVLTLAPLSEVDEVMIDHMRNQDGPRTVGVSTSVGDAIYEAVKDLKNSPSRARKTILLMTDGAPEYDGHLAPLTAADFAKEAGIEINVIALHSRDRVPYPIYNKDGKEDTVETLIALDDSTFGEIAKTTNGEYQVVKDKKELAAAIQNVYLKLVPKSPLKEN